MKGPEILARTMSVPSRRGRGKRTWQYHSRSDAHSKVACWTLLFDLLTECDVLRRDAALGKLRFRMNHVVVGQINKTLDLVVTRVNEAGDLERRATFADLVGGYAIALDPEDSQALERLPALYQERPNDISEVVIALEAKACMTEHIKSLPRLHAEILATGYLAKRAAPRCITVSYSLVNTASSFVTPSGNSRVNVHSQPEDARRVIEMLATAVPLSRDFHGQLGYDVIGVTAIECRNDGSPVQVHLEPPAPGPGDHVRYERMVNSICSEYRARFGA